MVTVLFTVEFLIKITALGGFLHEVFAAEWSVFGALAACLPLAALFSACAVDKIHNAVSCASCLRELTWDFGQTDMWTGGMSWTWL